MKAVQGSLGYTEPPRTVMTAEAAEEYDRKLIEAAKQQSLQEMVCLRLSSYIHNWCYCCVLKDVLKYLVYREISYKKASIYSEFFL